MVVLHPTPPSFFFGGFLLIFYAHVKSPFSGLRSVTEIILDLRNRYRGGDNVNAQPTLDRIYGGIFDKGGGNVTGLDDTFIPALDKMRTQRELRRGSQQGPKR